ncbi:hypothetical protein Hanom_Chr03g00262981 [Helianthus anomalus]
MRSANCTIKAPHCSSSPTRVRMRVRDASTLNESFHETIRMESSHLNTPLSFISSPMWDKVSLSHLFPHSSFKHQTLSIDI